jgi:hypothetical protein
MSEFKQSVFISLPVSHLSKSMDFYQSVGFTKKILFPENTGAWLFLTDAFSVVLLPHEKWKEFTDRVIPDAKKSAQFGLSISKESKAAVDKTIDQAVQAGGKADPNPVEEFEFMYGRSVEDPDGHILEFKWMDMSSMPPPF